MKRGKRVVMKLEVIKEDLRENAEKRYLSVWNSLKDIEEKKARIHLCGMGVTA